MDLEDIQAISFGMTGNKHRLQVAAAIGRSEGKPVSSKTLEEESGLGYSAVQAQVAWFRKHGLLVDDSDPDKRRKDFRAVATPYWAQCAAVLDDLRERPDFV